MWPKSSLQFDFKNHENVCTDLKKNIARQVLTYNSKNCHWLNRKKQQDNSKNFYWLNRKLDLERTMNGLVKPFRKKTDPKNWKNSKNQSEIAACEQKPLARNRNFNQIPFSHSTLQLERTISRRKTTRFFALLPVWAWPKSLLQFDFKNHENVWTDLQNGSTRYFW